MDEEVPPQYRLTGAATFLDNGAKVMQAPRFGSTTENAPSGETGRFWGYYREERPGGGQGRSGIWLVDEGLSPVVPGCFRWFRWRTGASLAHRRLALWVLAGCAPSAPVAAAIRSFVGNSRSATITGAKVFGTGISDPDTLLRLPHPRRHPEAVRNRSDKESASADEPVPVRAAMDRAENEEQAERLRLITGRRRRYR